MNTLNELLLKVYPKKSSFQNDFVSLWFQIVRKFNFIKIFKESEADIESYNKKNYIIVYENSREIILSSTKREYG